MARLTAILFVLVFVSAHISARPGTRAKRGFNNGATNYGNSDQGRPERHSQERDASVSREDNERGCNDANQSSDSRELAYNRDERLPEQHHGSRSFSKSSASASATSFNQDNKAAI